MQYCHRCGSELTPGMKFCGKCGTLVKSPPQATNVIKGAEPVSHRYLAWWLFGFVVIAIAGIWGYEHYQANQPLDSMPPAKISSQQATNSQASSTNEVSPAELAIMLYRKYYPQTELTGASSMILTKDNQGRQQIGFGTAASDLFFKVSGDQITAWKIKEDPDLPTYQQGYEQRTISKQELLASSYQGVAQRQGVQRIASQIKVDE